METFNCTNCGPLPLDKFTPSRGNGTINRPRRCIDCVKISNKIKDRKHYLSNEKRKNRYRDDEMYREKNKESVRRYAKKNAEALKIKQQAHRSGRKFRVFAKYGGQCVCCGESTYEFLAIDHVNGGGNLERKNGLTVSKLYKLLDDTQEVLDGYQVLCHNCNMAKGFYGSCPHQAIKGW